MKLICIKVGPTKDRHRLTIGKQYESIAHYGSKNDDDKIQSYLVINDENYKCLYDSSLFISVQETRNKKLENLGL